MIWWVLAACALCAARAGLVTIVDRWADGKDRMTDNRYPVNPDAPEEGYDVALAEPELQRFVYIVEGEPYVGTVHDLARAVREAHYAGLDMNPFVYVWTGDLAPVSWGVRPAGELHDDWAFYEVWLEGYPDTARYKIDLRA